MKPLIQSILSESADLKTKLAKDPQFIASLEKAATKVVETVRRGGIIYSCGNGGSACDSMHLTEELVARYKSDRPGIKAMHFMDPGVLTCWGNDKDFNDSFRRSAETFCTSNDLLIAISTSGKSPNVLAAIDAAKKKGTFVIGLTGKDGGKFPSVCDLSLVVPSPKTERIQEVHILIIHTICEFLE